jgi:hypothetical protein
MFFSRDPGVCFTLFMSAATNIVALRLPHEMFWVSQAKVHGVARLLFSVMSRDTENI